jgi:hypothetical protein
MASESTTVDEYLAGLPEDRREALSAVRKAILENLPEGCAEGMQYGMVGYFVPHSLYPAGYHCDPKQPLPFAGLASQKNYMSIYFHAAYVADGGATEWFGAAFAARGKKLDMGKACLRFKKLDDLPLDVIGEAIARIPVSEYIRRYEAVLESSRSARKPGKK